MIEIICENRRLDELCERTIPTAMEVAAGSIGIASFVIQIANSVARLKSFWDSTKEAPEDIKFMIEEIEILSSILSEIDVQNKQHQIPTTGNACAVKSLQLCRQGMDILLDVVKELDQNIAKRKHLGAIKACLKKDSLARHRARLESAKTMLLLSNQAYFTYVFLISFHMNWSESYYKLDVLASSTYYMMIDHLDSFIIVWTFLPVYCNVSVALDLQGLTSRP